MNLLRSIDGRGHLNDDQIAECLMGEETSPEVSAHLSYCEVCREELARFGVSVSSFNAVTLAWGESRAGVSLLGGRHDGAYQGERRFFAVGSWALATCLMLVMGLAFFVHRDHSTPAANVVSTAVLHEDSEAQIAQDNELLTEVDQAIRDYGRSPVQEYGLLPNTTDQSRPQGESRDQ